MSSITLHRSILLALGTITAITATIGIAPAAPASAYSTNGIQFFLDFTDATNAGDGVVIADKTGNGRDGTIHGAVSYDPATQAIAFAGGPNGSGFISLAGAYDDFSNGITIEFEGEFGNTRTDWERIFDFGTPGGGADDFWVGQLQTDNELALETWFGGVNQGRCHTAMNGQGLGAPGDRTFVKWVITVDPTDGCRMYRDGVEVPTQVKDAAYLTDTPIAANGSAYPLPLVSNRTDNFLGRSNWPQDSDFEGSIRYIRMYHVALSPAQVLENALNTGTAMQAAAEQPPVIAAAPDPEPTVASAELAQTGISQSSTPWLWHSGAAAAAIGATLLSVSRRRR